jgi:hypothetical protein
VTGWPTTEGFVDDERLVVVGIPEPPGFRAPLSEPLKGPGTPGCAVDIHVPVRLTTPVTPANSLVPLVGVSVRITEAVVEPRVPTKVPAAVPCKVAPSGAVSPKLPDNESDVVVPVIIGAETQPSMLNEPDPVLVVIVNVASKVCSTNEQPPVERVKVPVPLNGPLTSLFNWSAVVAEAATAGTTAIPAASPNPSNVEANLRIPPTSCS